jgi:hypothetical protein
MRAVRVQGCLPSLLLLLALAALVALALAAGTVAFAVAAALALAAGAVRWAWRLGRPAAPPRRPARPGAARDQVVEVEVEERREAQAQLPPTEGNFPLDREEP